MSVFRINDMLQGIVSWSALGQGASSPESVIPLKDFANTEKGNAVRTSFFREFQSFLKCRCASESVSSRIIAGL